MALGIWPKITTNYRNFTQYKSRFINHTENQNLTARICNEIFDQKLNKTQRITGIWDNYNGPSVFDTQKRNINCLLAFDTKLQLKIGILQQQFQVRVSPIITMNHWNFA